MNYYTCGVEVFVWHLTSDIRCVSFPHNDKLSSFLGCAQDRASWTRECVFVVTTFHLQRGVISHSSMLTHSVRGQQTTIYRLHATATVSIHTIASPSYDT